MHWSAPEGRDFLVWLARQPDGCGDADNYCRVMSRWHPNNGAASARHVLEELGVEGAAVTDPLAAAIWNRDGGETEGGRRRSTYWMRPDVLEGVRRIIRRGMDGRLGSKRSLAEHREELAALLARRESREPFDKLRACGRAQRPARQTELIET